MPAYKYKTEEEHQLHLAWRREHYQKNRKTIRERDNLAAKKMRAQDPQRFRNYQTAYKKKHAGDGEKVVDFKDNPDYDKIIAAILSARDDAAVSS